MRPGKEEPLVIVRASDPAKMQGQQGDFSNTQFALLGLRACRDARIVIPKQTWQGALDYMVKYQQEDGSWGYPHAGEKDEGGYASATAAGAAGCAICLKHLKKSPKSHAAVKKALAWLKKNWTPGENAGIVVDPRDPAYFSLLAAGRGAITARLILVSPGRTCIRQAGRGFPLFSQCPSSASGPIFS